jgi:DNA-binding NarL/FixJ family response regulator
MVVLTPRKCHLLHCNNAHVIAKYVETRTLAEPSMLRQCAGISWEGLLKASDIGAPAARTIGEAKLPRDPMVGRSSDMAVRVLIVDDHVVVRRGIRAMLESRTDFLICAEANSGREGVDLAIQHKPDIAVVDVSLPILNGIEVTRQIRKHSPLTEVLIFTMYDDETMIGEALRAGARGYLHKAEAGEQLLNAIATLARRRPFFTGAVSQALLNHLNSRKTGPAPVLTAREREVVQLIAEGSSNKAVGRALGISVKTVETHRAAAMRKLSLNSTAGLVRYALRNRIVQGAARPQDDETDNS